MCVVILGSDSTIVFSPAYPGLPCCLPLPTAPNGRFPPNCTCTFGHTDLTRSITPHATHTAGNAARQCPYGHSPGYCIAQNTTISGSIGADGMASVIAHELAEAVSDPLVRVRWHQLFALLLPHLLGMIISLSSPPPNLSSLPLLLLCTILSSAAACTHTLVQQPPTLHVARIMHRAITIPAPVFHPAEQRLV
jgi:hypothetical protein